MATSDTYNIGLRVLHWVSATIILWATLSGGLISYATVGDNIKHFVGSLNVSLTTVFIPIFIFRVLYRLNSEAPTYNNRLSAFEMRASRVAHIFLYVTTSMALLSGYLMMEKGINVFGMFELTNLIHSKSVQKMFASLHTASNHLLALLIIVHIGAVIKHEVKGISIFRRMALRRIL